MAEYDDALRKTSSCWETSISPVGAHTMNGSLAAAVTLTPPSGANKLLLQCTTGILRYTLDTTTTPTATVGFRITAALTPSPILIMLTPGMTVRVIEEAASATIAYQWGK